jgi:C-terminal processing protease CtpA/Prc
MDSCTLVTTAHDESITLKAMVESECSRYIVLYQHTFEKVPECSNEDIEYIKIEGFHADAVNEIKKALEDLEDVKFYLGNVHLDIYLLYHILREKEDYNIWILDNNQFIKMP